MKSQYFIIYCLEMDRLRYIRVWQNIFIIYYPLLIFYYMYIQEDVLPVEVWRKYSRRERRIIIFSSLSQFIIRLNENTKKGKNWKLKWIKRIDLSIDFRVSPRSQTNVKTESVRNNKIRYANVLCVMCTCREIYFAVKRRREDVYEFFMTRVELIEDGAILAFLR